MVAQVSLQETLTVGCHRRCYGGPCGILDRPDDRGERTAMVYEPPFQEKDNKDYEMDPEKSLRKWLAYEDLFWNEAPVDSPFVQEHS